MADALLLRCNVCGQPLGSFSTERVQYVCQVCGHVYLYENGILQCLRFADAKQISAASADQLSSFAHSNEATLQLAADRLAPLYAHTTRSADSCGGTFLDVGCGFGDILINAAAQYDLVVGVNIVYQELLEAQLRLAKWGVLNALFVHASAQNLPFMPGQFRAITCIQVLEHVRAPERALCELKGALSKDGVLFLSVPNRFTLRREPHTKLFGAGYLPRPAARWYAARCGRLDEFEGVNFLSTAQIAAWLKHEFGASFEFIRTGSHKSRLGQLAQSAWNMPVASVLARELVGDIEALAWQ